MKKITLLFFISIFSLTHAQNVPLNFETDGNGATWTWKTFENGTNLPLEIITNPFPNGINTSATVAKMTTLINGAQWAGVENIHPGSTPVGGPSPFGSYTITPSNCTVRIMVYKSVISPVGIKFATPTNGSTGQILVSNTLINQWEELVFDFSNKIGETNDQIIIFPDFQTRTSNNVCYFDNITIGPQIEKPNLPLDFESTTLNYIFQNAEFTSAVKIPNPYNTGINVSSNVVKVTKNLGVPWAGSFIELGTAINFLSSTSMKVKVWSPQPGIVVKLKLENLTNAAFNVETDVTNTVANAWEELTFAFPGIVNANNYKRVVLFFNFGFSGNGESYYFDDVKLAQGLANENFKTAPATLYPNPSNGQFSIESKSIIEKVSVCTLLGQEVVAVYPNSTTTSIDISNYSNGIYVVKTTSDSVVTSTKVVKQ
jgi:hypothetical protein